MNKEQEAKIDAELDKQDMSKENKEATKGIFKLIATLHQGDKLFLRNQLDMKLDDADDFLPAVALWKKRGGGMTEWRFVMEMTDEQIAIELGFVDDEPAKV